MRIFTLALVVGSLCASAIGGAQSEKSKEQAFSLGLVEKAKERTKSKVVYDGSYFVIPYPGGDVPKGKGVCTDVVIRAYRGQGLDLQKLVHEDMKANFDVYPNIWGLKKPDTNIDHRRVPNLRVFFKRRGKVLPVTKKSEDFKPGDIVTWNIGSSKRNIPHIGIVSDQRSQDKKRFKVVHNIGAGPQLEDVLFDYIMTGHYRFAPNI